MSVTNNKKISQEREEKVDTINNTNVASLSTDNNENSISISSKLLNYNNRKLTKINEFEFLVEKQDIVIDEKQEAIGRKYKQQQFRMRVPVRIFANELLVSHMLADCTLGQAMNVSTLPGVVKHVVVLPDGHEGYGFPVGGVAATDLHGQGESEAREEIGGVISPGGVGYDINCGVRLIRTDLVENDIKSKLKQLVNELFEAIPSGLGSKGQIKLTESELDKVLVEGAEWAISKGYGWHDIDTDVCEENGCIENADPTTQIVSDIAKRRGASQLGSLGSGNHFLEVQKVDKIFNKRVQRSWA